jgi:hypothetical protein
MALKSDGTVVAWGGNDNTGFNYGQAQVPSGLSDVVAIAAGEFHSLALTGNETMPTSRPRIISPVKINAGLHPFLYRIIAKGNPTGFGFGGGAPPGLNLDQSTGIISGTPTQAGIFSCIISALNSIGNNVADVVFFISPETSVLTSSTSVTAHLGLTVFYQITASNGPNQYTATGLPPGLFITLNGLIVGNPTTIGAYPVAVTASNEFSTASGTITITVNPAIPIPTTPPLVTSGNNFTLSWPAATGATAYTAQVSSTSNFSTVLSNSTVTTTSATFTGLTDGTTYYYRVRSEAGSYVSSWSNVVSSRQNANGPVVRVSNGVTYLYTTRNSLILNGTCTDALSTPQSVTVNGLTATTTDGFATWSIPLTLTTGDNFVTIVATGSVASGGGSTALSIVITRQTSTQGDGLPDTWKTAHGINPAAPSTESGPGGDPDHDGLTNLQEYAFNLDPQSPGSNPCRTSTQTNAADGLKYLTASITRLIGGADLTYIVEVSNDLVTWSSDSSHLVQLNVQTDANGITETVTYRVLPAIDINSNKFVRVRVNGP